MFYIYTPKHSLGASQSKMVAMVAAANKLLRQAFGVLKSGQPFNPNYVRNI